MNVLMWVLILLIMVIGLGICTVLLERLLYQRKQAKYDDLHKRMGLESHDHDPTMKQ